MYIYVYTHTYVRIYTYIHTYTFCKSRKRILVTYLVTDDQAGSATQFLGRYQGAPSTGRAATRNQRTLSASSRRYVFDHFDLRCLGRFDFWHFRLNIHAIREIGRSVFRFFFFLFFLGNAYAGKAFHPWFESIEFTSSESRLVEFAWMVVTRLSPSRDWSLEIGRVKSKRRDMAGTRQEGRNKTKNSERHFLHPNFRVEKSGIRGAWYTSRLFAKIFLPPPSLWSLGERGRDSSVAKRWFYSFDY